MAAMLGSFRAASILASRRKRPRRSGWFTNSAGRILRAISRSSLRSCARYTSPMPPAPRKATISYAPNFAPLFRAWFVKVGSRFIRPNAELLAQRIYSLKNCREFTEWPKTRNHQKPAPTLDQNAFTGQWSITRESIWDKQGCLAADALAPTRRNYRQQWFKWPWA